MPSASEISNLCRKLIWHKIDSWNHVGKILWFKRELKVIKMSKLCSWKSFRVMFYTHHSTKTVANKLVVLTTKYIQKFLLSKFFQSNFICYRSNPILGQNRFIYSICTCTGTSGSEGGSGNGRITHCGDNSSTGHVMQWSSLSQDGQRTEAYFCKP